MAGHRPAHQTACPQRSKAGFVCSGPGAPLPEKSWPSFEGSDPEGFCSIQASGRQHLIRHLNMHLNIPGLCLGGSRAVLYQAPGKLLSSSWSGLGAGWGCGRKRLIAQPRNPFSCPAALHLASSLPHCPSTRAPVSAPLLGKQQAFLSRSPLQRLGRDPSRPSRKGMAHRLPHSLFLLNNPETGWHSWCGSRSCSVGEPLYFSHSELWPGSLGRGRSTGPRSCQGGCGSQLEAGAHPRCT